MVRSSMMRYYYYEDSVPANNNGEPIIFGDVLLLNEQYAQYKGEIQLALRNRPGDTRINHLGKLTEGSKVLLKALKPYTDFRVKVQGI
ncbi:MAG: phospho-sugar glycosidase domain-containing protein [Bavariicoccus seileri]|uniref:phospho-sugar glycosidase domain-containing protein n=1 Tax=Bavariicoccus seileri TaxID=549685 RepID=UPI003F9E87E4